MARYSFRVTDGRRLNGYTVEAPSEDEAKRLFIQYLSFLGAVICDEIKVEEDK